MAESASGEVAVVEVQETRIFATGLGEDWWLLFSDRAGKAGRIETVAMTPQGGVHRVACDDRDHALWLRDHMLSHGVPATAAKVVAR